MSLHPVHPYFHPVHPGSKNSGDDELPPIGYLIPVHPGSDKSGGPKSIGVVGLKFFFVS